MNILLFGNNGQLGWELQRTLAPLGTVTALNMDDLNLEDFPAVRNCVRSIKPQIIINAAAYTEVDKAEKEPEKAFAINSVIPGILAEEARELNSTLLHFSSDYVFDGTKDSPYNENDQPNPLGVYGLSKLNGELAIQNIGGNYLIFRTAWVYSTRKGGFVTKVLEWARQQENLQIVDDQFSNPTWARMLAEITSLILFRYKEYTSERSGLYNLTCSGYTSRLDWARKIIELDPNKGEQKIQNILPAKTSDFPTSAKRPLFSALDCGKVSREFDIELPAWERILKLALER